MFKAYDDKTLVIMTLSGEQRAYEELVKRYQSRVLASAGSVLKSVYLAEDAAQDAFIAAWMKLDTLAEPDKFCGWVCRIAINRAKNMAIRYRQWTSLDDVENTRFDIDDSSSPERAFIAAEEKEQLHKALAELPEKVRTVIYLHYFEGLSVAEIADRMREPVGTVKWRLSDGRKRLRGELSAMNENVNDTLVEKVMKKVEELKLWASVSDKKDFEKSYKEVLSDVEALPESDDKYHAMADVLLRGFWWLPGKKNDEMLARIKEAAERGGNDEAISFLYAKEDEKLSGDAKIEFIRDKQIPSLEGRDFPLTLGNEWYALGVEYFKKGERENGFAAFEKALEILPKSSSQHALAQAAVKIEKTAEKEDFKDKNKYRYQFNATSFSVDLSKKDPVFSDEGFYSQNGVWTPSIVYNIGILTRMRDTDGYIAFSGKEPGYTYVSSSGSKLTLVSNGETVETPAGSFDNCELWETVSCEDYKGQYYRSWIKRGVGIVMHKYIVVDEAETVVLSSYNVKGEGVFPISKGNEWSYERLTDVPTVVRKIDLRVTHAYGKKAALYGTEFAERLYYDENCFSDMAFAVRSEYINREKEKEVICDVRDYVKKLSSAAKTKAEKAHARIASTVMNRIMDESTITENRQYNSIWNFFDYYRIVNKNGDTVISQNRDYAFEWKGWETGCEPLLMNFIYDILSECTGCVWSEQWVDGYTASKEKYNYDGNPQKLTVSCRDVGEVKVSCGTFDNCRNVTVEIDGFGQGRAYRNGKKVYCFAKGIGLIKAEFYDDDECVSYELTSYKGEGEGYFPVKDGLMRHYDLITDSPKFIGYAEHEFVQAEDGNIYLFGDLRGSEKLSAPDKYYETIDEKKASELWDECKFDEYYIRQGIVNLNIQIHALYEANPVNWFDGRMPAAHNIFSMKVMENFGENGVLPEIWYGCYAWKSLIASAALFSQSKDNEVKKAEAKKYFEIAFEYLKKWSDIPVGTVLPVGDPWLFGNIKAKKGGGRLILPDGTTERLYDKGLFMERKMSDVVSALKNWHWFDFVKNEPFFEEYVKRAEKYLK